MMKKWSIVVVALLAVSAVLYFLLSNKKDESGGLGIGSKDAVCIVEGVALRDAASSDGKFISTLSFGEKLTCTDEKEVKTSAGSKKFVKVELKGGNEGWVKESCIIKAAKPAVVVKEAVVYQRPDLITKTSKILSSYDILAIKLKQGDFVQVYGRTKDGKRVSGSWIKFDAISVEEVDVAVAIYVAKAYLLKDQNKRMLAIKEIVDNSDFKNSCFMTQLSSLTEPQDAIIEEVTDTSADTIGEEK